MVAITSMSLRRTLEIDAERLALEEGEARRLALLNELTGRILSGSLDPAAVLKTVAVSTSAISKLDRVLAVLLTGSEELVRAGTDPDPVVLTPRERSLVFDALSQNRPRRSRDEPLSGTPGAFVLCVPMQLDDGERGALLLWRQGKAGFTETEVSLLSAITQQMAVGVRLSRLYEIERSRALRSEERERLERELLSLVSHDLRTPLTAIRTGISALAEANGTRDLSSQDLYSRLARNVDRNVERLSGLVDDLLDIARLRSGWLRLDIHLENLGDIIIELATDVLPHLGGQGLNLALDLPARNNERWQKLACRVDRRRIEQVILNLFTNAQKFSPPGSTITIGATERNGELRLFVRDTGRGIPLDEQQRIFESYYSRDSYKGGAETSSSLGLGLAIARSIVEMHGGRIWVQSRPNAGSTFFVALPGSHEHTSH
jgi:K+-sensing histidine kinase KdpD